MKRFRPASEVREAHFLQEQPAFIKRQRVYGRYAVGVRYEKKVHKYLTELVEGIPRVEYREGPWIQFTDDSGLRWCQPDGILVDNKEGIAIIYEVKYQHTSDAWWQLKELYYPVVRKAMPEMRAIGLCEIVHWHDPHVQFPERYDFTSTPLRVPNVRTIAVCIFNPKRVALARGHGGQGVGEEADTERSAEG